MKKIEKIKNNIGEYKGYYDSLDKNDKETIDNIEKYGCMVFGIFGEEDEPQFTFSVGLYDNYNHPEIILINFPQEVAHQIINNLKDEIKEGFKYEVNKKYNEVLVGYDVYFKNVDKKYYQEYLGTAKWYYSGEIFPVIQLVGPDKNNKFPWEKEYDKNHIQPILD